MCDYDESSIIIKARENRKEVNHEEKQRHT